MFVFSENEENHRLPFDSVVEVEMTAALFANLPAEGLPSPEIIRGALLPAGVNEQLA